jgi:CO dehydrogenase maturation factor
MARIVTMGRGGTGKTSFVSLLAKYFIAVKDTPLLLIDADADQNLAEMVGVDLANVGKSTISEILYTVLDEGGTLTGVPPQDRIEGRIWDSGLYEGETFDLMAIGTKWREGCYCLPNNVLKKLIPEMTNRYKHTLIDSPAGLEHLNRRITPEVDDIFDILDYSKKAFEHVTRAHRIMQEIHIDYDNFYLVGGREFPEKLEEKVQRETGFKYLGSIAYDETLRDYVLEGKSLIDLPSTSPAYVSVKSILERAGYTPLQQLFFPERG